MDFMKLATDCHEAANDAARAAGRRIATLIPPSDAVIALIVMEVLRRLVDALIDGILEALRPVKPAPVLALIKR